MMKLFTALALAIALVPLTTRAAAAPEKEWSFLLYINGNNNLDSFGKLNLNQLEAVGSSDAVNLVAQWASLANGDVRRLLVQKDSDTSRVTSPVLQNLGSVDMGDVRNLEDFVKWGITNYPAKHYFVAVWDHGSGWRAAQALGGATIHPLDISWDDNTGHSITTKQLGTAMSDIAQWLGRKIDVYGSDACLMGMAEVAGEMKDSVAYYVGSQQTEPGAGWPYTQIFAPLIANPQMSPRDFSMQLATEYARSYSGGSNGTQDVTMSVYDMSQYASIETAVANLGTEVDHMPNAARAKIFSAAGAAISFAYNDYVDLGDFLKQINSQQIREIDAHVLGSVNAAISQFVIASKNTGSFATASGLSIWIPKESSTLSEYIGTYKTLQWDTDTRWSTALNELVK